MTMSKPVFDRLGLGLWIGAFLVVLVLVLWAPDTRTVLLAYRYGSQEFLAGRPLYNIQSEMGYLYAPAFAALYIPLFKLGPQLGGLVWHITGFAVLTFAAMRQVRKLGGSELPWLLSFGLFLALPMALGAIRNGQATILLTGACWLLTLSALEGRRAETFFWASVAVIAKPTAIIMLLLVGALRLRLIPVLVLAVLFVIALPYAFAPAGYLNDQYRVFAGMLTSMAVDNTSHFVPTDFTAPFIKMGLPIPEFGATIIRIVMALFTLSIVVWFDRKLERGTADLAIFLTATFYMCVFNPRVEPNTYAMIAVPAGLAVALLWREERGGVLASVLSVTLFLTGLTGVDRHIHDFFYPWFRPIAVTAVAGSLIWWFWAKARDKVTRDKVTRDKVMNEGPVANG
ncbi:glycosyltransferase family 87 protein [Mesorhizobium sp. dw_380]|uniref:glycosyltransferase family 87 protein n=1 Tax=Mesorhizobium sp. dw_380 TaxID=2812001 RepID=UPI001BDED972|nr:glycosyltransferase family 87 protein [Mesorhizobium sp. dw_380]